MCQNGEALSPHHHLLALSKYFSSLIPSLPPPYFLPSPHPCTTHFILQVRRKQQVRSKNVALSVLLSARAFSLTTPPRPPLCFLSLTPALPFSSCRCAGNNKCVPKRDGAISSAECPGFLTYGTPPFPLLSALDPFPLHALLVCRCAGNNKCVPKRDGAISSAECPGFLTYDTEECGGGGGSSSYGADGRTLRRLGVGVHVLNVGDVDLKVSCE